MQRFYPIRKRIRDTLLRGWVLRLWVQWKARRLEKRYLREVVSASGSGVAITAPLPRLDRLRRLAFIADITWERQSLIPELERLAPVDALDLHPYLPSSGRQGMDCAQAVSQGVANWIQQPERKEPDILIFYARSELLSDDVFTTLRTRWTCPMVGMNLDDKVQFLDYRLFSRRGDNYMKWAPYFDVSLTNVLAVVDWYRSRGLSCHYMAEGCSTCAPPAEKPFQREVAFVGTCRDERSRMIRELSRFGYEVKTFGTGWPNAQEPTNPRDIFATSQINLGMGWAEPSCALTTLKGRDFECPGAGGCYLTTWNWELPMHFDVGREILCYRGIEELIEMIAFYRRHPEECRRIGLAGHRRCMREHTWAHRFQELFEKMDLHISIKP